MKSAAVDYWREYFRTANSDIFEIIDHAIIVAASDCPKEFRLRRDRIAERLFSTCCSGCIQLHPPPDVQTAGGGIKDSKLNTTDSLNDILNVNYDDQFLSNFSYGDAEALTDVIEEESRDLAEVFRIKNLLDNSSDESDTVLFESLRRLQLMALTVDTLKATEIGKSVNVLRKHGSKQIRNLARTLIDGWKVLVDEWYSTAKPIRGDEGTPESLNPSVVDDEEEEGLPSPPLDEAFLFSAQTTGIELSQFFDGMDDDGNPRNSGEFSKNREKGRKSSMEHQNITKRKQQMSHELNHVTQDKKTQQIRKQELVVKPSKPSAGSGPGRPLKQNIERKPNNEAKIERRTVETISQRKPSNIQKDCSDEVAVQMKLEATKRKLQERYQQAENAKRQRTIQVMELQDLPKQGSGPKNLQMRPGNHNRHRPQGRR
ncbi:Transcription elongation factor (TFIIS) family protein [Euphorbia peplus]|nr:Transcription elongation factor (TFIIS) family protein [Euphorbia peplus]